MLAAWCELRQDFRHFRTDRVSEAEFLEDRYPARNDVLRAQWRKAAEAERERWTGQMRQASAAIVSAIAATTLPKTSNVGSRPRWPASAPARTAGTESEE